MSKILNIQGSEITDTGVIRLADYLKTALPDDFTLIIGCTPYVNDIDGVLIGRGNIYAVECKNWKGQIEANSYGTWLQDGEPRGNPLHQARNNAVALAKWLRSRVGSYEKVWVRGLLVFTHDKCYIIDKRDGDSNTGVTVLRLDELGGWIMKQKEVMNKEVVEKVEGAFEGVKGKEVKVKNEFSITKTIDVKKKYNKPVGIAFILFIILGVFLNSGVFIALSVAAGVIYVINLIIGNREYNVEFSSSNGDPFELNSRMMNPHTDYLDMRNHFNIHHQD